VSIGGDAGLIPRAVSFMFQKLAALPQEHYAIKASFLEIYNEDLVDLLQPGRVRARSGDHCILHYNALPVRAHAL
jgi:hypothetical protein